MPGSGLTGSSLPVSGLAGSSSFLPVFSPGVTGVSSFLPSSGLGVGVGVSFSFLPVFSPGVTGVSFSFLLVSVFSVVPGCTVVPPLFGFTFSCGHKAATYKRVYSSPLTIKEIFCSIVA